MGRERSHSLLVGLGLNVMVVVGSLLAMLQVVVVVLVAMVAADLQVQSGLSMMVVAPLLAMLQVVVVVLGAMVAAALLQVPSGQGMVVLVMAPLLAMLCLVAIMVAPDSEADASTKVALQRWLLLLSVVATLVVASLVVEACRPAAQSLCAAAHCAAAPGSNRHDGSPTPCHNNDSWGMACHPRTDHRLSMGVLAAAVLALVVPGWQGRDRSPAVSAAAVKEGWFPTSLDTCCAKQMPIHGSVQCQQSCS